MSTNATISNNAANFNMSIVQYLEWIERQAKDDTMDAGDCIAHIAWIADLVEQSALRDELAAMLARVTQIGDELKAAIEKQQG